MPSATVNGLQYDYEEKGSGLPIVLAHGLTFDRRMWDHQVETLSPRYRCIAYDFLGHGGSPGGAGGRVAGARRWGVQGRHGGAPARPRAAAGRALPDDTRRLRRGGAAG